MAIAKLENHYFVNNCWMEEGQIMKNIDRLRDIPITIVHGRYDMVCPVSNSFAVADALSQSKLIVLSDSGHSYKKIPTRKIVRSLLRSFTRRHTDK